MVKRDPSVHLLTPSASEERHPNCDSLCSARRGDLRLALFQTELKHFVPRRQWGFVQNEIKLDARLPSCRSKFSKFYLFYQIRPREGCVWCLLAASKSFSLFDEILALPFRIGANAFFSFVLGFF